LANGRINSLKVIEINVVILFFKEIQMIPSEFIRKRYVDEENNITHNFRIHEI